jgi:hypothetical protein
VGEHRREHAAEAWRVLLVLPRRRERLSAILLRQRPGEVQQFAQLPLRQLPGLPHQPGDPRPGLRVQRGQPRRHLHPGDDIQIGHVHPERRREPAQKRPDRRLAGNRSPEFAFLILRARQVSHVQFPALEQARQENTETGILAHLPSSGPAEMGTSRLA